MKILVTGGAGFIGSHVAELLIENGHDVVVIDNLSSGVKNSIDSRAKFYEVDLADNSRVQYIFDKERFDVVYHLAAQIDVRKSVDNPVEDARVNVLASLNLLELSVKHGIKHFIFSSTGGAIYGDNVAIPTNEESLEKPLSPYGCAKLSIEKYLNYYNAVYGLKYTALRYSNVYGPRQNPHGEAGVIAIFFNKMLRNESPIIFGGFQTRDFVFVEDVARANLLVLSDTKSEVYNVGAGFETSISGLFEKMNSFFGGKFISEYREKKKGEQERSCLNYDKIKKNLEWKPEIMIDEGLKKTHDWFYQRYILII
ncbi:MAG: NAD-dependent epimerase/dehydratase family protein [Nanoarchaeota archaeon]